jgi:hypothetical protein
VLQATESAAPPQDEERFSTSWANELKYLVSRNFKLMFRYANVWRNVCMARNRRPRPVFLGFSCLFVFSDLIMIC